MNESIREDRQSLCLDVDHLLTKNTNAKLSSEDILVEFTANFILF